MAAFLVLQLVFVALLLADVGEWVVVSCFPRLAQALSNSGASYLEYGLWLPIITLAALWIILLVLALAGSTRPMPLLSLITRRPWVIRFSFIINSVVLALIPLVAMFAFHASSLTRTARPGAAVYFLYDEGISVPRWGYALGLYRVSMQAQRNWGNDSIVLDRLNRETLRTALADGKVVIIATHGGNGVACTYYAPEKLGISAPDSGATDQQNDPRFLRIGVLGADDKWDAVENVAVNGGLRLMYLFGCDVGKRASQWQEHLLPARVITYNRASTVFDHAWWFAFTGPALLRNLQ